MVYTVERGGERERRWKSHPLSRARVTGPLGPKSIFRKFFQIINVCSLQRIGEVEKIAKEKIVIRQHGREVQIPALGRPESESHFPASSSVRQG